MKTKAKVRRTGLWLISAAVIALSAVVGYGLSHQSGDSAIPAGTGLTSWYENGRDGRYLLHVIEGSADHAAAGTLGTVRTDSNCAPDAQGLSHCHNIIELASGERITVVDTHQMSRHRCLRPGEAVRVRRVNRDWVIAQVAVL